MLVLPSLPQRLFLKTDGVFVRLPVNLRRNLLSGPSTTKRLTNEASGNSRTNPRMEGALTRGVDFVFKPANTLEPHIEARIRAQEERKEKREVGLLAGIALLARIALRVRCGHPARFANHFPAALA